MRCLEGYFEFKKEILGFSTQETTDSSKSYIPMGNILEKEYESNPRDYNILGKIS